MTLRNFNACVWAYAFYTKCISSQAPQTTEATATTTTTSIPAIATVATE